MTPTTALYSIPPDQVSLPILPSFLESKVLSRIQRTRHRMLVRATEAEKYIVGRRLQPGHKGMKGCLTASAPKVSTFVVCNYLSTPAQKDSHEKEMIQGVTSRTEPISFYHLAGLEHCSRSYPYIPFCSNQLTIRSSFGSRLGSPGSDK